jgi:diguanylate cyclase (GGDEF)-like protein/PAS domain S-box-containing protein
MTRGRKLGAALRGLPRLLAQGPAAGALLVGLAITALLFYGIRVLEQQRIQDEFESGAATRVAAVHEGLEDAVDALATVNRLFATVGPVERGQFEAFAAPLLARNPQLRAFAYQRMVTGAERAAFEAARRRQFPGFAITELQDGKPVPAPPRAQYRVVDYIAPLAGNETTLGLDANTRHEIDAATRRACETGKVAMSGQFDIIVGHRAQPGFALMMPVYRPGATGHGCADVEGYTVAAVGSAALVGQTLASQRLVAAPEFDVSVYESASADPAALVFHVSPAPGSAPSALAALLGGGEHRTGATFEVAGRAWHVEVAARQARVLPHSLGSLLMLAGGLASSLLAAAYAGALAARERGVYRLVKQRTAALREANGSLRLMREAIEACVNSIIITSAEGPDYPIEFVNPAFEKMTGFSAAEVIGRSAAMLWGSDRDQPGVREIVAIAREEREGQAVLRTWRKDGAMQWSDVYVAPVRDAGGRVRHYVVAHYDITEKRRYEAELAHQATHDALTGLANRELLARRLRQEIGSAARHEYPLWVLFVDLDRFKHVNDSLGHRAGDQFLQTIAARLVAAVRPEDTVARLGGDEFVLVLSTRGHGALDASAVDRVMAAIARPVAIDGQDFYVGASIGIACYPNDGARPETLIEYADLAMFRAKEQGRNNYQFYQPEMNEQAQERRRMELALRRGLEREEFVLHYQPQLDLKSGRVIGAEALLRWRHPELGLLEPERFLALAEDTGLMVPIGAWVMRSACAQMVRWQRAGHAGLRLALNLSLRQFNEPDLVQRVGAILGEAGLAPGQLELELTERMVMQDVAGAVQVLDGLRALGVSLALDDFGTGYSSLAQLERFPLDALKIDQSFVRTLSRQGNDAAIPDAIVSLAHNLGMRVVAEGVETEAQCELLARNMCDEVQGQLFAPALDAEAFESLLAEGRTLPEQLRRMHKREGTLLLVDDEPNILTALKRQLRGLGFRILTAPGGREGLALLETEHVDVIVSDQRMPGMTGVEFLRIVKNSHPDTVRMVLSGFTELQSVTDAVNEGAIYKFLTKPWDDTLLRAHIQEAFRHKQMADDNHRLDLEVRTANHNLAQANRQLEQALRQQEEQISRTGISLDIAREALQQVPLPVIGVDEELMVVFANLAALDRFRRDGLMLGGQVDLFMPALADVPDGRGSIATAHGRFEVVVHRMGKGSRARGRLIIFQPAPAIAAPAVSLQETP